jgi:hypothetical protein
MGLLRTGELQMISVVLALENKNKVRCRTTFAWKLLCRQAIYSHLRPLPLIARTVVIFQACPDMNSLHSTSYSPFQTETVADTGVYGPWLELTFLPQKVVPSHWSGDGFDLYSLATSRSVTATNKKT